MRSVCPQRGVRETDVAHPGFSIQQPGCTYLLSTQKSRADVVGESDISLFCRAGLHLHPEHCLSVSGTHFFFFMEEVTGTLQKKHTLQRSLDMVTHCDDCHEETFFPEMYYASTCQK